MFLTKNNKNQFNSFKIGYSRGLPSHQAIKLLKNKKTEEYFVTSLFAQSLLYSGVPITGIEVCDDDSNKGSDTVIKILDCVPKKIQVTRFTLTQYLKRKKIAEKKVESLISKILELSTVQFPINVTVNLINIDYKSFKSQKIETILAKEIVKGITENQIELSTSNNFVNYIITNDQLKFLLLC